MFSFLSVYYYPQTPPSCRSMCYLGYPSYHRGYKCYDLSSRKIIISRHVFFDEATFPFSHSHSPSPQNYQFLDDTVPIRLLKTAHTHSSSQPMHQIGPDSTLSPTATPPSSPTQPMLSTGLDHPLGPTADPNTSLCPPDFFNRPIAAFGPDALQPTPFFSSSSPFHPPTSTRLALRDPAHYQPHTSSSSSNPDSPSSPPGMVFSNPIPNTTPELYLFLFHPYPKLLSMPFVTRTGS